MVSKNRDALILDALDSIVIVLDSRLIITYYNSAFLKHFSFSKENHPTNLDSLFPHNRGWINQIKSVFEGKKISFEGYFSISNQSLWLEITGFLDKEKNEIILIIKNKSKSQQAELVELENKFQGVFNFSKIAIAIVDTNSNILMVNQAFIDFLGYTAKEFYQMTFVDFTHPADVDIDIHHYTQLVNGKIDSFTLDKRYIHKEGHIIWGALTASIVRNPDSDKTFALGMVEDITAKKESQIALKNYQQELTELVKELQLVNKDLESFAYSISHDLRTPLRYIEGFSKLLKRRIVINDEETECYFSHISEGIQTMSSMIDALLNFSRLGRRSIEKEIVDMNEVIAEAIKEFIHISNKRNIKWEIGKLPMIFGDSALILMVFENLISNAIKFTKDKKEAIIEIQRLKTPDQEGKITISIKDNGVGFDMNYSDKLFGVFQRLHSQEEFEGTGIGLANVKKIIDKHGGSIRIDAEEDRGATFYITL